MPTLSTLASGENIIYIATRLFDYAEKLKAEDVEEAVACGVARALRDAGIVANRGVRATFVPFRDTTQKTADGLPTNAIVDLNQVIYTEDVQRLDRSFALIGFFDGLAKDEGISMEIGYCFGIQRPIVLIISDFVREGFKAVSGKEHLVDPVIHAMASQIIYQYSIPAAGSTFKEQLQIALQMLYSKVEEATYRLCRGELTRTEDEWQEPPEVPAVRYDVCLDFGGGLFEWQRLLQQKLADKLTCDGLSCVISDRYSYYEDHENGKLVEELGWRDIGKVQSSRVIVTCSDSTEMGSGTAALQGYSRALGKKVLLYDSKTTNMVGDNSYKQSRNLMIVYSADCRVSRFDDLPAAVGKLLEG